MLPSRRDQGQGSGLSTQTINPFDLFRRQMDSVMSRFFNPGLSPFDVDFGSMRVWDFDLREEENATIVEAEMPGFEPDDIDVQINNNMLTIKAERQQKGDREQSYNSFR